MLLTAIPLPCTDPATLGRLADAAGRAIPPLWPLASSVAVNPFLGQTGEGLALTSARLARAGGIALTMPRGWYAERIATGAIGREDLAAALAAAPDALRPATVEALLAEAAGPAPLPAALPTLADLAAARGGTDWPGLIADRIGHWAAGHYDAGQALWAQGGGPRAFAAWRAQAQHDLTPEIAGLGGFCAFVAAMPEDPLPAMARAAETLGLPETALPGYFHRLLLTLGGWAQYARYRQFEAELHGGSCDDVTALLAIRLTWEAALWVQAGDALTADWAAAVSAHAEQVAAGPGEVVNAILQEAAERAGQRQIAAALAAPVAPAAADQRPDLQAAFCIDVRSEPFRRALESVHPSIRTLGFAGFFGLGTAHRAMGSDTVEARLPVLLLPGLGSVAGDGSVAAEAADAEVRIAARAARAWGRFRQAAVSSFAFVEAMGPVYAGKLLRDALGLGTPELPHDPAPRLDPALPLAARVASAAAVLRAMSLTEGFAPLVLIAGHGANVTNNPHASALHCGACGGYSGEVNARLLAGLLNDADLRRALLAEGITIPADTCFVPALHDTTTDAVITYEGDLPEPLPAAALARLKAWLAEGGARTRAERAPRLPGAQAGADLPLRSRNWAELRPEWGLAGCRAFIAAPRSRTCGRNLAGRAFLHDYDWRKDQGFGVLELILTAPVVVASWISLQYYGSTVAPAAFGGGNKLLHNVVGGIGVLEGNGGAPRPGLPWQSVQDGTALQHEPLRLSVLVEAPTAAIADVLARHDGVRALFDNVWLHLLALDDDGRMAWRYRPGLVWGPAA